MSGFTSEQLAEIVKAAMGPMIEEQDKKIGRVAERMLSLDAEVRDLRGRVHRLEQLLERMGKIALQERV